MESMLSEDNWLARIFLATNKMGRFFYSAGIYKDKSRVDRILAKAKRDAKVAEITDDSFLEPLEILVQSMNEQPTLSTVGRRTLRNILVRRVSNRLQIDAYFKAHPECLDEPIDTPVVIAALPRTGTTLLHRLFSQDPALRVPRQWEMDFPCPPPEKETYDTDPRIKKEERVEWLIDQLAPETKRIHEYGARLPEECMFLFANDLISDFFGLLVDLPLYRKWLAEQDLRFAYERHKKQLQLLQHRYRGERWVLKAPSHLRSLSSLIAVYPDAVVIQTHRNPVEIVASAASFLHAYWSIFHDQFDPEKVGPIALNMIGTYINQSMKDRDLAEKNPNCHVRFIDVPYLKMVAHPVETIKSIYDQCGLTWSASLEQRMNFFLEHNRKAKFGKHRYTLEQYGLKPEAVQEWFATYNERFIHPESTLEPVAADTPEAEY